jgi:hypothetical protein
MREREVVFPVSPLIAIIGPLRNEVKEITPERKSKESPSWLVISLVIVP